ncbi:Hypothetical predicted protein [Mytilus galloprovincialis]|uniref:SRCR domain-containing protein n=1 Tax=Mytilus galloprovincialis TaxID=29158 RepID=A0A8B6DW90_MYTGA|nr:Hypothetical predicted protein [Mytilus galloprovincialis]
MASLCVVECQLSGDLRMLATSETNKGRLEIYYKGEWGTICDRGFDHVDAAVACRQLGFCSGKAIPAYEVDNGQGTIWFDKVDCSGSEHKLINCTLSLDLTSYCYHGLDVGLHCYLSCPAEEDEGLLRIINSTVENKGRLEINYKGEWGTICNAGFHHVNAAVACRQLGYWCVLRIKQNHKYIHEFKSIESAYFIPSSKCVSRFVCLTAQQHFKYGFLKSYQ